MRELFLYAFIIALKNLTVYALFWEGMLLGRVRIVIANLFDRIFGLSASKYIQKPLWSCLVCMSSVWTAIWLALDGFRDIGLFIDVALIVCGLSVLIDILIHQPEDIEI